MPFAAALSEHPDPAHAIGEATGRVLEQLGERPDLALLFVTAPHEAALPSIVQTVRTILDPELLIGCSAVSVVGVAREVEEAPAVSLWAGAIGGVQAMRLSAVPVGPGEVGISGWPEPEELPFEPSALVLLADPHSFPAEAFLAFVDERCPGLPVVGGMASAARMPGGARLLVDVDVVTSGAVGAFLGPGVEVEPVVSQGCRPVGDAWSVTAADGNIVRGLGGRPPLERLADVVRGADEFDAHLLTAGGLHVGRVIDEHKADFGRGDFLVRNVLGGDQSSGAIAIATMSGSERRCSSTSATR